MEFRPLQADDTARLFAFEHDNRAWFEQFIEARPEAFYSLDGVADHIKECLAEQARGVLLPFVFVDAQGCIVGRANLKDIDREAASATIGYRIGRESAGKGLASSAVAQLRQAARTQLALAQLVAYVSVENPGSARVLEKNGFVKTNLLPQMAHLKHKKIDCFEYVNFRP